MAIALSAGHQTSLPHSRNVDAAPDELDVEERWGRLAIEYFQALFCSFRELVLFVRGDLVAFEASSCRIEYWGDRIVVALEPSHKMGWSPGDEVRRCPPRGTERWKRTSKDQREAQSRRCFCALLAYFCGGGEKPGVVTSEYRGFQGDAPVATTHPATLCCLLMSPTDL